MSGTIHEELSRSSRAQGPALGACTICAAEHTTNGWTCQRLSEMNGTLVLDLRNCSFCTFYYALTFSDFLRHGPDAALSLDVRKVFDLRNA